MSSFLFQDRTLKLYRGQEITSFPAKVTFRITFAPEDAFGVQSDGYSERSTLKVDAQHGYMVDERDGSVLYEGAFIERLNDSFNNKGFAFQLDGNVLSFKLEVDSKDTLLWYATSANQLLPVFLSYRLHIFVSVKSFTISCDNSFYHFFIARIRLPVNITTAESNTSRVRSSCDSWLVCREGMERLLHSFHYYRQALHLSGLGPGQQTMVAETLLNLAKSLEMIFSDNRERFRKIADEIGLESEFVEAKLLPIILLRSKMAVAHASTAPIRLDERDKIQEYMFSAFGNIQFVLDVVWKKVLAGEYKLKPASKKLEKEEADLLKRIEGYLLLPNKQI